MSRTDHQEPLVDNECLLHPYVRITQLLGTALLILVIFIILTLFGFRGRSRKIEPMPETILQWNEYAVPILIALLIVSILALIFINLVPDRHYNQRISIHGHQLTVTLNDRIVNINLATVTPLSFRVMPGFHALFRNEFHRIGRMSFSANNTRQVIFFPIRNGYIADTLLQIATKTSSVTVKSGVTVK